MVKIWNVPDIGEAVVDPEFEMAYKEAGHSGWVRDVAWAPGIGIYM